MRNAAWILAIVAGLAACDRGPSRVPIREVRPVAEGQQVAVPETSSAERFGFTAAERQAPGAETPPPLSWETPEGWVEQAPRPMRLVTFAVGEAECYVAVLRGDGGGLEANVNRWRRQMAQPPLAEAELAELPAIEVLGTAAPFIEIEGTYRDMSGAAHEDSLLFGVACLLGDGSVFVKMTGPAAAVRPQRARFVAFCGSLK
ncbi:MAG TPA: hypothetical protein PLO37_23095 [Candidatus Hydrogenedentes bacterium]|nr:hypothetical protein [Candidatus Hydrogenedentota bacterium]HPG69746.1 hypothetical protein [Candidatus Hydrogenedentota bacterium]